MQAKNKIFKTLIRALSVILTVILCLILIINIYSIFSRYVLKEKHPVLFGWSNAVVITGSMEPTINVNDMIIIKKQKEYHVGDIVTFNHEGDVVTHRIILQVGDVYTTKGDNNNIHDGNTLTKSDIYGKVVFVIPKVGVVLRFMRTPLGVFILLMLVFAVLEISAIKNKKKTKGVIEDEGQCAK